MMSVLLRLGLATAACGVLGACEGTTDDDIVGASLAEVRELASDTEKDPHAALFVDARPAKYFEQGHIPKAINVQLYDVPNDSSRRRASWEAFSTMIVYGDDPGSDPAAGLTKRLMATKYKDVRLFRGGVKEWKDAGLPVETGPAAPLPPPKKQ